MQLVRGFIFSQLMTSTGHHVSVSLNSINIAVTISGSGDSKTLVFSIKDNSGSFEPITREIDLVSPSAVPTPQAHQSAEVPAPPRALLRLALKLGSSEGPLEPQARITRAYEFGFLQEKHCSAGWDLPVLPPIALKNRVFGVLAGSDGVFKPNWCSSAEAFHKVVGKPVGVLSLSGSFPSQAELQAYFFGAGLLELPSQTI